MHALRPHIRIYWICWGVILLGFVVWRLWFVAPSGRGEDIFLFLCYAFATWIPTMALNLHEGFRLTLYLRMHHPGKWKELSSVMMGGSTRFANGFRMLPWLFSNDAQNDPVLAEIKCEYRQFLALVLAIFLTFPIVFFILLT